MRNQFRVRFHGDRCVYCGERANSDEHFPPASYGNLGYLLPACRECNSFAGTAHPLNFKARVWYVKEKIKNHAPRFTFTSEVTLHDILEMPEKMWLRELNAEKVKLIFRRRISFDAMAYISTIQSRRFKFVIDMSSQIEGPFEDVSEWQDLEDIGIRTDAVAIAEDRKAMDDAHQEELLSSLLENLPKISRKGRDEVLLDEDVEFVAAVVDFGPLMTSDEFLKLLIRLRSHAVFTDAAEICGLGRLDLIALVKRVA